jgi:hypothetical protein
LVLGATADSATAAVKEILPAIELADFDPVPTPDNLDVVLEGNLYQRHVILCGNTRFGGGTSGLASRVIRRGVEAARTTELEALTGKLPDIVAHVANTLAAYGGSFPPAMSSSPAQSRRRSCSKHTTKN